MGRAPCCDKVGLKKGKWTEEEDEILVNYIKVHGEGSWRSLPKKAGLLRCGKSCRLRWINYLRSGLKRGNFSEEEEDLIIKLHASLGNKWSQIASKLPGRTDNDIKNYWNTHLSRSICYYQQAEHCKENSEVMPVKPLKSSNKNSTGKNNERIAQTTKKTRQRKITVKVLYPESLSLTKHCDEKAESEFSSMTDADAINNGPSRSSIKFDNSEFSCTTDKPCTSMEEKIINELNSPDLSEFLKDMDFLNYESKEADTANWNNGIFGDVEDGNLLVHLDEEIENWGYLDSLWDLDLWSSFRL